MYSRTRLRSLSSSRVLWVLMPQPPPGPAEPNPLALRLLTWGVTGMPNLALTSLICLIPRTHQPGVKPVERQSQLRWGEEASSSRLRASRCTASGITLHNAFS